MENKIWGGAKIANEKLTDTIDIPTLKKTVSENEGAVGFGPLELVDDSVKVPKYETIGRPLTFITDIRWGRIGTILK